MSDWVITGVAAPSLLFPASETCWDYIFKYETELFAKLSIRYELLS